MKLVFISYPKSGRTWMRYVFHLLSEVELRLTHAGYGTERAALLRQKTFRGINPKYLGDKNLFMHRNPLDTAVSMYFQIHKHVFRGLKKKLKLDYLKTAVRGKLPPRDIRSSVLHPALGVENICKFNRAWLDYFSDNLPQCPIVTYEDAKDDLRRVINVFVDYLDLPETKVEEVLAKSSFSKMKKVELQGAPKELKLYGMQSNDPETMKVRKGVVRGYTEYLDDATIESARGIANRYGFDV